jgi:hypothetical protein
MDLGLKGKVVIITGAAPTGFHNFTPFYMFQKGKYFPLYVEVTAK